ncbi:hypothetical protein N8581_03955 [Akkermansiaceae bacterium]|nr:hypothetical protein [Akkermansiaceae bacterium]MDB4788976.1 hypothetical protein [Akkermansiaceae bacterium]
MQIKHQRVYAPSAPAQQMRDAARSLARNAYLLPSTLPIDNLHPFSLNHAP